MELYSPLLVAVGLTPECLSEGKCQKCQNVKFEQIKTYANSAFAGKTEDLKTSLDAQVLQGLALADITETFRARDIANKLNENKDPDEQFGAKSIGWALSRLGFKATRLQDGNRGWQWNEGLFKRRVEQFGFTVEGLKRFCTVVQSSKKTQKTCGMCDLIHNSSCVYPGGNYETLPEACDFALGCKSFKPKGVV